jgi:co-chaperonin GroES (HSP10)
MQPIGKFISAKNIDEETKTESGIILSGEHMDSQRYKRAEVIAPGTDVHFIKTGDKIYYDKANTFTMLVDGIQCTILREQDVVIVE